jgi:hypothetical protein
MLTVIEELESPGTATTNRLLGFVRHRQSEQATLPPSPTSDCESGALRGNITHIGIGAQRTPKTDLPKFTN